MQRPRCFANGSQNSEPCELRIGLQVFRDGIGVWKGFDRIPVFSSSYPLPSSCIAAFFGTHLVHLTELNATLNKSNMIITPFVHCHCLPTRQSICDGGSLTILFVEWSLRDRGPLGQRKTADLSPSRWRVDEVRRFARARGPRVMTLAVLLWDGRAWRWSLSRHLDGLTKKCSS
jgi:hypothetical protein